MKRLKPSIFLFSILFVIVISASAQVWDVSDYSEYKTANQYLEAYPDQEDFSNYPVFSWDKAARWAILRSANGFDSVDIRGLAQNYQLVAFEKSNPQGLSSVEAGTIRASERLKAVNPNMKTVFYFNTVVAYGGYETNDEYLANAWDWSQHTTGVDGQDTFKVIRGFLNMYDSNVPELRKWWVQTVNNVVSDPAVDGVFIDKVGSYDGPFFDENELH
ncbi:putative glycoside hydrolase [Bacteroidota bacterium]